MESITLIDDRADNGPGYAARYLFAMSFVAEAVLNTSRTTGVSATKLDCRVMLVGKECKV